MSSLDAGYSTEGTTTMTSERAGFWRRFAAFFIDAILLGILSGILRLILGRNAGGRARLSHRHRLLHLLPRQHRPDAG